MLLQCDTASSFTTLTTIHHSVSSSSAGRHGRRRTLCCVSSCRRPQLSRPLLHRRPTHRQQRRQQHRLSSSPTSCESKVESLWRACSGSVQPTSSATCSRRCSPPHERGCLSAMTTSPSTCILPAAAMMTCPREAQTLKTPSPHCSLRLWSGIATSVASSSSRGRCLPLPAAKVSSV
jgi:hypothetical protein